MTGRREGFARLRHAGGVSGYPSRGESEHDVIENSHASASLSYAYGLAVGRDAGGSDRHVVAVIGDGALTGGMAYEALNNLGCSGRRVIVVVNDNGRSYAPTVSRLVAGRDGDAARFFAALGFDYAGPVDGHDIPRPSTRCATASQHPGPSVVHVLTRKGRGYRPAEDDDREVPARRLPVRRRVGRAAIAPARSRTRTRSPKRCSGSPTSTPSWWRSRRRCPGPPGCSPFAARHPDRCFDVGIAEQHAVTAAAGMAMRGLRPVVAIYSTFLNRAWDQVVHDVGLHRLPVVFCVDRAGITGDDGPSHHGVYDLALLTKVPGMTVFAPSSYAEVGVMLREAMRITSGPVALRWPKTPAPEGDGVGTGTRARRVLEGRDVCILAVGKMVEAAREAAEILAGDAIRPTVWDVRSVPLDERMLTAAARSPLVVTVEDGIAEGGVGSLITSALARRRDDRGPRVVVLGTPLAYLPHGKVPDLLAQLGLDGAGIAAAAVKALRDLERAGRAGRAGLAVAGGRGRVPHERLDVVDRPRQHLLVGASARPCPPAATSIGTSRSRRRVTPHETTSPSATVSIIRIRSCSAGGS